MIAVRRVTTSALVVCLVMALGLLLLGVGGPRAQADDITRTDLRVAVRAETSAAVTLDASVFVPAGEGRHPAVILSTGFGGTKADSESRARLLAERGYLVLTYTTRGFGNSGGLIHLAARDYEVADVGKLIDLLAARPDVLLDGPGDPRVGVAGASYGGALSLGAAADPRVDAVVAAITWHDLSAGLAANGVVKQRWISSFVTGAMGSANSSASPASSARAPASACGRFDATLCPLLQGLSVSGQVTAQTVAELRRRTPVTGSVAAPVLLVQGLGDSLFGAEEALRNAQALRSANPSLPISVRWFDGGHDGGEAPADADTLLPWFDTYVRDRRGSVTPYAASPLPAFAFPAPSTRRGGGMRFLTTDTVPAPPAPTGVVDSAAAATRSGLSLTGGGGRLVSPPGGEPAALVLVPGGSGLDSVATTAGAYRLAALPLQSVAFDSAPVTAATTIVGAPRVRLKVTSSTTDATLFVSLWRVTAGGATMPRRLVTPIRVATTPGVPVDVDVALPTGTYALDEGSTWRVLVTATESSFALPRDTRVYDVSLATPAVLTTPGVPLEHEGEVVDRELVGVAAALTVVLLLGGLLWGILAARRRRTDHRVRAELAEVPLAVDNLVKTYRDGHRAVDDVSWRAERGQVVGLLGPNGAGKTTTMRMLVGLIAPDSGTVHVNGVRVGPGAEVLRDVGALIEGPGFLPHLSGLDNLHAYWAATGRPEAEAGFDDALGVAALGDAIDRPVRSYSQGMKQRLGIAQAMLGRPRVLLLDEPTNGLDPPQIAAMRPILQAYAASGRTVVVSSHLLAEVEATCSHVVVMHRGRVLLTGAVADLVESDDTCVAELEQSAEAIDEVVSRLPDEWDVEVDGSRVVVHAPGEQRATIVNALVAAGAAITNVSGRRHLEEVFLGVIAHSDAGAGHHVRVDPDDLRMVRPR